MESPHDTCLRLHAGVVALLAGPPPSIPMSEVRGTLESILRLPIEEDDEECIRIKETVVHQLLDILRSLGDGEGVVALLCTLAPPVLHLLPKVKSTKMIRVLFDGVVELKVPLARQAEVCRQLVKWAAEEHRVFLRCRLELRLAEIIFQQRLSSSDAAAEDSESIPTSAAAAATSTTTPLMTAMKMVRKVLEELRRLDDRPLLLEAHLLECRICFAARSIGRARAALVCARTTAAAMYCGPLQQAAIDFQSGLLHAEEKDFRTAFSYFFEAFEGYHGMGDAARQAKWVLRYVVLSKILSGSQEEVNALMSSAHVLAYHSNGSDFHLLRRIATAYASCDVYTFHQLLHGDANSSQRQQDEDEEGDASHLGAASDVLDEYTTPLLRDDVLRRHLDHMYDTLVKHHVKRVIQPYHRIELSHLTTLLRLPTPEDVEMRISKLILDKEVRGIVDQQCHVLIVFDDEEGGVTAAAAAPAPPSSSSIRARQAASAGAGHTSSSAVAADEYSRSAAAKTAADRRKRRVEELRAGPSLYEEALEAIAEYEKLTVVLMDKANGKFDVPTTTTTTTTTPAAVTASAAGSSAK